jgi:hypothetical protein
MEQNFGGGGGGMNLPVVAGFKFAVGAKVAKIDKLLFWPKPGDVTELLQLVQQQGSPCETAKLRCDDQGEQGGNYVRTQFQLGGSEERVNRSDPSNQSTSFTQVNVSFASRRHPMCNMALMHAHKYSYNTQNVVTIDVLEEKASPGISKTSITANYICSNCKYKKPYTAAQVPEKCPRCKQVYTLEKEKT